jgi:regulator of sigma E protease
MIGRILGSRYILLVPLLLLAVYSFGPQTLVTFVLFFLILGVTVVIHELGHFVAARLAKVRVIEFGVGFPPRAAVLRDQGETIYTLNWLPIGGFVKLEGEDGGDADEPRSFSAQGIVTKVLILAAGVAMNLVLAFAIFVSIALTGDPAAGVLVTYVTPGSPAEAAGLTVGDVIEHVDDRAFSFFGPSSVISELVAQAGQTVTLHVRHADGSLTDLTATLRTPDEVAAGQGALGIGRRDVLDPVTGAVTVPGIPLQLRKLDETVNYPIATSVRLGLDRTVGATQLIVSGVGDLISNFVTRPTERPNASGPLGIAVEIGNTFWTLGPIVTLYLAGLLSANLAVVNILPLPPLDGGRILVLVLKRALGTRLSLRAERLTYVVGAAVLFAFLVWVTAFDVLAPAGPP